MVTSRGCRWGKVSGCSPAGQGQEPDEPGSAAPVQVPMQAPSLSSAWLTGSHKAGGKPLPAAHTALPAPWTPSAHAARAQLCSKCPESCWHHANTIAKSTLKRDASATALAVLPPAPSSPGSHYPLWIQVDGFCIANDGFLPLATRGEIPSFLPAAENRAMSWAHTAQQGDCHRARTHTWLEGSKGRWWI